MNNKYYINHPMDKIIDGIIDINRWADKNNIAMPTLDDDWNTLEDEIWFSVDHDVYRYDLHTCIGKYF